MNSNIFCNMYADDTVIVVSAKDTDSAVNEAKTILGDTQDWGTLNNIKVNVKKKNMLIGKQQRNSITDMCLDDVACVENVVYVGVNIDKRMNF